MAVESSQNEGRGAIVIHTVHVKVDGLLLSLSSAIVLIAYTHVYTLLLKD